MASLNDESLGKGTPSILECQAQLGKLLEDHEVDDYVIELIHELEKLRRFFVIDKQRYTETKEQHDKLLGVCNDTALIGKSLDLVESARNAAQNSAKDYNAKHVDVSLHKFKKIILLVNRALEKEKSATKE